MPKVEPASFRHNVMPTAATEAMERKIGSFSMAQASSKDLVGFDRLVPRQQKGLQHRTAARALVDTYGGHFRGQKTKKMKR